jgi:hypothetical protein
VPVDEERGVEVVPQCEFGSGWEQSSHTHRP